MGTALAAARPSWLSVWWRAVRPYAFTASVTPVLVGTAVAIEHGFFHPALLLGTLAAAMAIHAATNLTNDYYDHVRGVDATQPIGPGGAIQQGLLSPRAVLTGAIALFALSGVIGFWLVAVRGWPVLVIGVLSVLAGYAYTGGPLPLGYIGLGDLTVFLFMGVVTVAGSYYVQTGSVSAAAIWASLPVAALVDGILVANNLRDIDNDRAKGKRTFATLIGRGPTRMFFLLLLLSAYVTVALAVALDVLPPTVLLVFLTVPAASSVWRVVRGTNEAMPLTLGGIRGTAQLHLKVGGLIALGLLLPVLIRAF